MDAKLESRPKEVEITDQSAVVPLQQLLNHTLARILKKDPRIEQEMIKLASHNSDQLSVMFTFKLGFDGSGSHHRHMQPDNQGDLPDVKCLIASQMVPLLLESSSLSQNQKLWESSIPNSPHACRPIRLSFEKENNENVIQEYCRLKDELLNLQDYVVSQSPDITISFQGLFTLFDGKNVSILTGQLTVDSELS